MYVIHTLLLVVSCTLVIVKVSKGRTITHQLNTMTRYKHQDLDTSDMFSPRLTEKKTTASDFFIYLAIMSLAGFGLALIVMSYFPEV